MLSVKNLTAGKAAYYAAEDYYTQARPGFWLGRGTLALGLQGPVHAGDLTALFRGEQPGTGLPLVQKQKGREHQSGWDLTWSVPKSVAALWSQGPAWLRAEMESVCTLAAQRTLTFAEDRLGQGRRGHAGRERERVGLVFAVFWHETSRAGDPQPHLHAVLLNVGVRPDGTTGTVLSQPFYAWKTALGTLFRAEVAALLEERIGVVTEREGFSFHVQGVPQSLCDAFSKRRREVEESLRLRGYASARAAAVAALDTREPKGVMDTEALFSTWREVGRLHGFSENEALSLLHQAQDREHAREAREACRAALVRVTDRSSHFSERELFRHLAEEAQGRGLGLTAVRLTVEEVLSQEALSLGRHYGEIRYTTSEVLALERQALSRFERLHASSGIMTKRETLAEAVRATEEKLTQAARAKDPAVREFRLSSQETAALEHLLTPHKVHVLHGLSGSARTTVLRATGEVLRLSGIEVVLACFSDAQAIALKGRTGVEGLTLTKLLLAIDEGQRRLTEQTAVIVVEAGKAGPRQLSRLIELAEGAGAWLILTGNGRKVQAAEPAGLFAAAAQRFGCVPLPESVWEENAREVLCGLAEEGHLHVALDRHKAVEALIARWRSAGVKSPQDHLILASDRAEAAELDRLAQAERRKARALGEDSVPLGSGPVFVGDRVLCTRTSAPLGIRAGSVGTVLSILRGGEALSVGLDNGSLVLVPFAAYGAHLKLGYALTNVTGQGSAVPRSVYVLAGGPLREANYGALLRAGFEVEVFLDRAEAGEALTDLARKRARTQSLVPVRDVASPPERAPSQSDREVGP
jgi:conjugative relaxase-like TrwC/TraI family protein